jgi:hypothetical protein
MSDAAPSCLDDAEAIAFREGELTRNRSQAVEQHLATCADCRGRVQELTDLARAIAAPPEAADAEVDLVAAVRRRASLPPPRRAWWPRFAAAGAVLAAAGVLLAVGLRPSAGPAGSAFQARGGATPDDAWVGLRLFRVAGTGAIAATHLKRDDAVLLAYDNNGPRPFTHLMVVGADAQGGVYWYYPALAADGADGQSIAIQPGAGIELRDEIRHALKPGPLRLYALFTRAPLSVRAVEQALRTAGDPTRAERLPIGDGAQHSLLVNVDAD